MDSSRKRTSEHDRKATSIAARLGKSLQKQCSALGKPLLKSLRVRIGAGVACLIVGLIGYLYVNVSSHFSIERFVEQVQKDSSDQTFDLVTFPIGRASAEKLVTDSDKTANASFWFKQKLAFPRLRVHETSVLPRHRPPHPDFLGRRFLEKGGSVDAVVSGTAVGEEVIWSVLWRPDEFSLKLLDGPSIISDNGATHRQVLNDQLQGLSKSFHEEILDVVRVLYGIWLIQQGDEAVSGQSFLTIFPHHSRAAMLAATRYLISTGRWSSASKIIDQMRELFPDDPDMHLEAARVALWGQSDWLETESFARLVVDHIPNHPEAWRLIGLSRLFQGRYEEALKAFESIPEQLRLSPPFLAGYLDALLRTDDLDQAARHARVALERSYAPAWLHIVLGWIAEKQGELGEAKDYYLRAIRKDPNARLALLRLSGVYLNQGHSDKCLSALYTVLAQGFNHRKVTAVLPDILSDPRLSTCWEDWLSSATSDKRSPAIVALMKAFRYAGHMNWEAVREESEKAYALQRSLGAAHILAGWAMWNQERNDETSVSILPDERHKQYEAAARVSPDLSIAHVYYAVALIHRREWKLARAHLMTAIRLDPFYAEAYWRLATLPVKAGSTKEAELRRALEWVDIAMRHHTEVGPQFLPYFHATKWELLIRLDEKELAIKAANDVLRHATDPQLRGEATDYLDSTRNSSGDTK